MRYNILFFSIFIYFCVVMQSLYAMENCLLADKSDQFIHVQGIANDKYYQGINNHKEQIYCAHYGKDSNTLIAVNKAGCYKIDLKENKVHRISDFGWDIKPYDSVIYEKMKVHPNGRELIVAKDKNIAIYDIIEGKLKWSKEEKYLVDSVCFASEANSLLVLSRAEGFLKKYNYENCKSNEYRSACTLAIDYDLLISINFVAHKSILCVAEKYTKNGKSEAIVRLCNAFDLNVRKIYKDSELVQLDPNESSLTGYVPCQISDNGFVALVEKDGSSPINKSQLLIFDGAYHNELRFKCSISCKDSWFCNTLFYPAFSPIILTISDSKNVDKRIMQYWDIETGKCLYETMMYDNSRASSISVAPDGKYAAITTYGSGCTVYNVPVCVANKHISQVPYRLFLLKEQCAQSGVEVPQDVRGVIAKHMFL